MTPRRRRYDRGAPGFVIASARTFTSNATGEDVTHTSYWYGPRHGWGTTYGGLGYSTAVFASRPAAKRAYEEAGNVWTDGESFARVTDLERELEAKGFVYDSERVAWTL